MYYEIQQQNCVTASNDWFIIKWNKWFSNTEESLLFWNKLTHKWAQREQSDYCQACFAVKIKEMKLFSSAKLAKKPHPAAHNDTITGSSEEIIENMVDIQCGQKFGHTLKHAFFFFFYIYLWYWIHIYPNFVKVFTVVQIVQEHTLGLVHKLIFIHMKDLYAKQN